MSGGSPFLTRSPDLTMAAPKLMAVLTENRAPDVVAMLKSAGMSEFTYNAFEHRLRPANDVPMANALFLRDPTYVMNCVTDTEE